MKAESDVRVTSANAVEVVNPWKKSGHLCSGLQPGPFCFRENRQRIIPWHGYCVTHHRVFPGDIEKARQAHPEAVVIVHPECRPEVVALADAALGTGGMIKFCKETDKQEIIVGTEMGMLYRLKKECPDKTFYLLSPGLICPNMKYTTVQKVITSLEQMKTQVTVDAAIREKAARALQRMLAFLQTKDSDAAGKR